MDYKNYRYVIVGSGFFGAVIAERIASDLKKEVLILERRGHVGGNSFSEDDVETGIHYHKYGPHIFHTSDDGVWKYINNFAQFNNYYHQVLSCHKNRMYQLPINLETINNFYNVNLKPFEVDSFLATEIRKEHLAEPSNFEEKAISMVGRPLYEAFIKNYTQKQWGRAPVSLPAAILTRLPFRTNYLESYFEDSWQGIPIGGYTKIFEKMFNNSNIQVVLNTDFFTVRHLLRDDAVIIYTGPLDKLFDYCYGRLEWRKVSFKKEIVNVADYQGTAVINYPEEKFLYTRIVEPKHFHPEKVAKTGRTLIVKEYSEDDSTGEFPFYPINDNINQVIADKYKAEAAKIPRLFIGGRLGEYQYYNMDAVIKKALSLYYNEIKPSIV